MPKTIKPQKEQVIYFRLDEDLTERVRDAIHWARVGSLVEFGFNAFKRECERLEREQNNGKRFPRRPTRERART